MKQQNRKTHWEEVYRNKATHNVSWFQPHAERSLRLIKESQIALNATILDVGGGASTLVDDLLGAGYKRINVLDLSAAALAHAQLRCGERASNVNWLETDILETEFAPQSIDLWHDRAVFHFLTSAEDRRRYVAQVLHAVKKDGHVIIATFAEDGPLQCSGLDVRRYSYTALHAEFGAPFTLKKHERETHHTPAGKEQYFTYCYCQKSA
ncbi:MAG: class I SAM-dependent methyltransferase [Gammaproteobacteria bacterium]|nr:class I SAM-dependent methyltransferase [Gammaproteobacteria bacterium]